MQTTTVRRGALGALTFFLIALTACSDSNGPGGGGGGGNGTDLVVSNATPASGNATLSGYTVTVDTNSAVQQGPAIYVVVSGTAGNVGHEIGFYILKSDESIPNLEHFWGSGNTVDGFTICDANGGAFNTCDAAHVTADIAGKSVTFTGLVLGAAQGDGDASTLTGTVAY
ncbi:MAG: hypothetical protein IPK12_03430 [Gemmatimonadetes bacterium]|nr:hypothetical protein [Gemmatimonadota bacterium]